MPAPLNEHSCTCRDFGGQLLPLMGECSLVGSGLCPFPETPQRELAGGSSPSPFPTQGNRSARLFSDIAAREENGTNFTCAIQASYYQRRNGSFITIFFFPSHSSLYISERKNANLLIVFPEEKISLRRTFLQAIQYCLSLQNNSVYGMDWVGGCLIFIAFKVARKTKM